MKILTVSDTVMPTLESAANLRRRYNDIDVIVSCGDMPRAYLDFVATITGAPLFYVRGNHDERYDTDPPGGIDLHMKFFKYRGLSFIGLEGSIQYNRGNIQYTHWEMRFMVWKLVLRLLHRRRRYGYAADVFVAHSPAWGIHDAEDRPHHGFKPFLEMLRWLRPRYMFHGHVHTWDRRKTVKTKYHETCIMNINPYTIVEIEPVESGIADDTH